MKKSVLKIISVVLVVMTVFLTCCCAFASGTSDDAGDEIPVRYTNIAAATLVFTVNGINAHCGASLSAKKSMSLQIVMSLQKKNSDGTWSVVKTWSKSGTGTSLSTSQTRIINLLSTYRLKGTFTAGGETTTIYRYL